MPAGVPDWLQPLLSAVSGNAPALLFPYIPPAGGGHRESAVLVLFGEGPGGPDLLLIERAASLRSHAGQPAFPGGMIDPQDDGPVAAALREAWEETGLEPAGVEPLAELPPVWLAPSGVSVVPVIAWWRRPSAVAPRDAAEVSAVERVPLGELADPANRLRVRHPSGFVGPAFAVRSLLVWGFTAGIVDRLLELGGWARPWDHDRVRELPEDVVSLARRERWERGVQA